MTSVQYRLVVGKKDERVDGPDDAALVFSVPMAVVDGSFDATVEFMRGRLKATGDTGEVLALLKSGAVDEAIRQLSSRP